MYKVFINANSLIFYKKPTSASLAYEGEQQLQEIIDRLENSESEHLEIHDENLEKSAWPAFKIFYTEIEAAGGVVKNEAGEVLMIYRLEHWDLPKGKLESEEKPDEAAIREVQEECALPQPQLLGQLADTYHTYVLDGNRILKRTYWYEMAVSGQPDLKPQEEEDITKAEWCTKGELRQNVEDTYGNIRDLLKPYLL